MTYVTRKLFLISLLEFVIEAEEDVAKQSSVDKRCAPFMYAHHASNSIAKSWPPRCSVSTSGRGRVGRPRNRCTQVDAEHPVFDRAEKIVVFPVVNNRVGRGYTLEMPSPGGRHPVRTPCRSGFSSI
jgi:hypothetical protein